MMPAVGMFGDIGFRVQRFRVQGSKVQGSGFFDFGFWILDFGFIKKAYRVLLPGSGFKGSGFKAKGKKKLPYTLNLIPYTLSLSIPEGLKILGMVAQRPNFFHPLAKESEIQF